MPGAEVIRKGDMNQVKGLVKNGDDSVLCNGKPTAVKGKSQVKPHPGSGKSKHPTNPIAKGCKSVLVGGKPMAFAGVPDQCKHIMIKKASPDVLVSMEMD